MEEEGLNKEMQELKMQYEKNLVADLKEKLGAYKIVKNYAIISREGVCKLNNFEDINEETLSIMAATLYGAASTVSSELRRKDPEFIRIDSGDDSAVIFPVGNDNKILLFLDVSKQNDLEKLVSDLKATSKSQ